MLILSYCQDNHFDLLLEAYTCGCLRNWDGCRQKSFPVKCFNVNFLSVFHSFRLQKIIKNKQLQQFENVKKYQIKFVMIAYFLNSATSVPFSQAATNIWLIIVTSMSCVHN